VEVVKFLKSVRQPRRGRNPFLAGRVAGDSGETGRTGPDDRNRVDMGPQGSSDFEGGSQGRDGHHVPDGLIKKPVERGSEWGGIEKAGERAWAKKTFL